MNNLRARRLVDGYLHTKGRIMVNGNEEEIILAGWGAGSWNNPEGFMCGDIVREWTNSDPHAVPQRFDRARTIEDSIRLLCGTEYAKKFWPRWYQNHLGEADIKAMAELGYNSVRLPLNARSFLPEEPGFQWNEQSFAMLDQVIDWCEQYRLYAILDMHTAPGGQTGLKCDDGLESTPRFYLEPESVERFIELWKKLADRYKERWIVGAYDLLNEPLAKPDTLYLIPQLKELYQKLICEIRKIDQKHMLTIEGASAATNNEIFDQNYDEICNNWCIHIHYYGFLPQVRSFYPYLEPSIRLNVPVWLGEGGGEPEEAGPLLQVAESLHMGFNLWGWKTALQENGRALFHSPLKFKLPQGWSKVINSLNNGAPRPAYTECQHIFERLLENIKYQNCEKDNVQHRYLLRQSGCVLQAAAFDDALEEGISFHGSWCYGNPYAFRTEDRMHLLLKDGELPPRTGNAFAKDEGFRTNKPIKHLLLQLDAGDFAEYTFYDVSQSALLNIWARATEPVDLQIQWGEQKTEICLLQSKEFNRYSIHAVPAGEKITIRIGVESGSAQIEKLQLL